MPACAEGPTTLRLPKACLALAVVFSRALSGQTVPKFEIADVHARPPNTILAMRWGFAQGRYEVRNATMVDLIRTAWNVSADSVAGGPDWLEMDRFDVVASASPGSSKEALRAMLRALLEERFHLVAHEGTRDVPAFALTTSKKLQLTKSDGSEESGCRIAPGPYYTNTLAFTCRNMNMAAFAGMLPKMRGAADYLFNYAVVDRTGLEGGWNFSVKWSLRVATPKAPLPAEPVGLFDAFEKQLGLDLEMVKIPTPAIVVESVEEHPTPNSPEVAANFPAPAMEFEVAEIKPVDPKTPDFGAHIKIEHGGRVDIAMSLRNLIQEAWGDFPSDRIVGGPKFIETARFTVVAKAPATDLSSDGAVFNGIDIDSMRAMLKKLMMDRFGLEAHLEDRAVNGYALVAARPKLHKAEPGNRPSCKEGPGADGKDPRLANPIASRLVTCRNVTMDQLAAELTIVDGGDPHRMPAVVNSSGIVGRYDITINFTPGAVVGALTPANPNSDAASDPNGAIPLFEALERQLGLKLEARKVMAPVLVIDHVNEMPTEN